jgi:hypothetical protein
MNGRFQKVRPWLTRLYPRAWKLRYGTEFEALLEQCLSTPLDVVDIILGAFDAHLSLLPGNSLNWRIMNTLNKIRTTLLIVFAAYIGFVIAGLALVGLADDSPMVDLMKTDPFLSAVWVAIQVGAAIALLAVVSGGFPLTITAIRRALKNPHRGLGLLLVPVVSFLVLAAYMGFLFSVGSGRIYLPGVVRVVQPEPFPAGNRLLMAGLMVIFVLGAIVSTLSVWKIVSGIDVEEETFQVIHQSATVKIYRFAYLPAVVASVAMLLMLAGTITWGALSFSALPHVLLENFGPWGTSTLPWFIGIVSLMTISTLAAFFGIFRGRAPKIIA